MPVVGSFASLSKNGFNGGNSGGTPLPPTTNAWFSVVDLKVNGAGTLGNIKLIGSEIWMYGYGGSIGSVYRPYAVRFSTTTGLVNYYKVFSDIAPFGAPWRSINDVEIDSSNNRYYLTNDAINLFKYDNTDTFSVGYTYTGTSVSIGSPINMVKDSSNYLYVLSSRSTDYTITKIDPSTLAIIWAYQITITNNSSRIYIDASDNLYVTTWTSSGSLNTIIKFNTSGSIVWQQASSNFTDSFNNRFDFDSNNNLFVAAGGSTASLVSKINSSGTVSYSVYVPVPPSAGGDYIGMTINSYDYIVLQSYWPTGVYAWTNTVTLTNTGSVVQTTRVGASTGDIFNTADVTSGTSLYMSGQMLFGRPPKVMLRLSPNNNASITGSFNFTETSDNGSTNSYSGTVTSLTLSNPTPYSASVTFTATSYTTSSVSITTTSITPTLGSTIPYSYAITI